MVVAKIVIKDNYEKENDLVLRSYIRALQKINENPYLEGNRAYIYGIIDKDNNFYEMLTGKYIPYKSYETVSEEEFQSLVHNISEDVLYRIYDVMKYFLLKEGNINEVDEMRELAQDRAVEFEAYNRQFIAHNPYSSPYDGYNDLIFKCNEIEKVKKIV